MATSSDAPPGAVNLSALVLWRLGADGRTKRRELVGEGETFAGGTLAPAGRCLLVSGWSAKPPTVWAIDPGSLDTLARWTFPGATMLAAQAAGEGQDLDVVRVDAGGGVARASAPLPSPCAQRRRASKHDRRIPGANAHGPTQST